MGGYRKVLSRIWLVVAVVGAGLLLLDGMPKVVSALGTGTPWDGSVDWQSAQSWREGKNAYSTEELKAHGMLGYGGMGHPPTTPFWFIPLARLDQRMMSQVVGHLALFALLLHVMLVATELRAPRPWATGLLVFAATLDTWWWIDHLKVAQISEFIALLYVLAWYSLRRDREVTAGALLGAATTMKLFPGVMVGMLLVSRRYRGFAAACLTWLAVAAVMTWNYGLIAWKQFFQQQGRISEIWISHIRNGSLQGIVLRCFIPPCGHGGGPRLSATLISVALSLLLLAGAWRLSRGSLRSARTIDLPFGLFAVLSFFINPWVWEHYDVLLILPFGIAAASLVAARRAGLGWRWTGAGALALAAIVPMLGWDMEERLRVYNNFALRSSPAMHLRVHLLDALGWLPTVLLLGVLAALSGWLAKHPLPDRPPDPPLPPPPR